MARQLIPAFTEEGLLYRRERQVCLRLLSFRGPLRRGSVIDTCTGHCLTDDWMQDNGAVLRDDVVAGGHDQVGGLWDLKRTSVNDHADRCPQVGRSS